MSDDYDYEAADRAQRIADTQRETIRVAEKAVRAFGEEVQWLRQQLERCSAELQAARAVVHAARNLELNQGWVVWEPLEEALAAYDQITKETT